MLVTRSAAGGVAVPEADDVVTALYGSQYRSLVRLAVLLGGDVRAAEEVAQTSFVALHAAWPRLLDRDAAIAFLLRAVVSRCRPARPARAARQARPSAEAAGSPDPRIMNAVRALPGRQREAVVLRLFLDLPDGQAAAAMGVSPGTLRDHASRAMAVLRPVL